MRSEGTPNSHAEIWKPRVTIRRWLKGGRGVNRLDNLRLLVVVADRVRGGTRSAASRSMLSNRFRSHPEAVTRSPPALCAYTSFRPRQGRLENVELGKRPGGLRRRAP